jgi:U3 small nucleolar RNA-associated protein 6
MAAEKARFYLEQSVPELREWERKKIFSKDEIASIAKKRSDFEHLLNSRGESTPSDYAQYASYEMNLNALRRKREKRVGVKATSHTGQRRVFFILDRGTKKFPGDLRLWTQYIEFAKKEHAHKRLEKILTKVLRLHPTKPELWVWAAKYMLEEQADMLAARGYMQRGLRFCENDSTLWLEYARLEMIYVAKFAARQRILGLDETAMKQEVTDVDDGMTADTIVLPEVTAEDINPGLRDDKGYHATLQNLASMPALSGAIPIAIFDSAMKHFKNDETLAEQFFDLVSEFDQTPCSRRILQHILDFLIHSRPRTMSACICKFKLPLFGVVPTSPDFPGALRESLQTIRGSMEELPEAKKQVASRAVSWLTQLMQNADLDSDVRTALTASIRQFSKISEAG